MSQSKKSMIKNLLNLPFKIGSKDSRQSVLSYDEAVRRVPEQDLQRVKKSFKKDAVSDYLPKTVFITQVMGESVPSRVAEAMYVAFGGGSRGISYKDLVSGLVLLSCGTQMEKLDFLFHLCSGGSSSMPVSDLIATIKISEDGHVPDHVVHAFSAATSVTADMFREWISRYWSSMALTRWLLESDFKPELIAEPGRDEIPTFYQTLAGVTHLDEKEIFTLEKFYLSTKSSRNLSFGRFDVSLFASLVSPPLPSCIVVNLFQAFDENGDGHLDLKEIVCGVSACCRGPLTERQKFLYKVFDIRRQKRLGVDEISNMLSVLLSVDDGRANGEMVERLAEDLADQFGEETVTNGRVLALEGFLIWAQKSGFTSKFMKLLFQICHVVLGLRPQNKEDELSCIIEWLQRDSHRPKNVGDVYYIVNMDWWKSWRRYAEDGFSETSFISDMDTLSNGRKRSNALNNLADLLPRISSRPASRASTPTLSRSSSTMSVQASRHPGPINNQPLVLPEKEKCKSITDEGAVLKKRSDGTQLRENEDFVLVSESVWKVLSLWYSVNGPELPRLCVRMGQEDAVDVDVFPVCLRLLRHRITDMNRPYNPYPYGGMVGGSHAFSYVPNGSRGSPLVERIIFASACFSSTARFSDMHDTFCRKLRLPFDDVRLWVYVDENNLTLVEDESVTVGQLNLKDLDQILLEMRNKDLTWPEELTSLSHCSPSNRRTIARSGSISREDGGYEKGCCGLNNLGNTCFMNSALQCISYSRPLTYYFRTGNFLGELNRKNPIGFGGMIAERYAELLTQLWSGRMRTLAPVKLKSAISQNTRAFNGFQQHDSQELLAFILDGLHEDLNRVHEKPYVELNDSEGRPDEVVAEEAWENHLRRNQSIVVDLFHGLLKSRVKCLTCSKASVRFDPFSILSLPLPLDNLIFVEFPLVRHGLRIDPECNMEGLRDAYAAVSRLDCEEIVIAEVGQGLVRRFYSGDVKLQSAVPASDSRLLMYQIPVLSSSSSIVSKADEDCVSHGSYSGQMDARWIVAVHRRMVHNETYYLAWAKAIPKTFGLPVLVACDETTTTRDLYERVWQQIKRFIGPETPISEESNHAQECNTQTGGYSFSLKLVREDGCWCSACPWYRFCRGCLLLPSDHLFAFASGTVVIDWEPTFYHLRYQESLEFIMEEDESVRRARTEHCEPITLDSCLKAFTHEEKLGPDALYQCSKCGKGQLASKRMQLWRLPPVLAVHFKRFQKVRDHWVKSHKIVTFPKSGLDLSQYLAVPDAPMTPVSFLAADIEGKPVATSESVNPASVPDKKERPANGSRIHQGDGDCSRSDDFETGNSVSPVRNYLERSSSHEFETEDGNAEPKVNGLDRPTEDEKRDTNGEKPGAVKKDVHHHRLSAGIDAGDLKYDLYAICCHSGLLATGHYVAYCKNPNGKWYLFNDSSCKELTEEQMDTSTSYMLFYERRGLDYSAYLPPLPPPPVPTDQTELSRNTSSSSTLHDGSHPDSDLPVRESRPNADTALPDDPKSQCTLQ